ncbi:Dipeptide transport system permease protein DppB (TC 3.A.1.5.2) [[Actinomadura] parvosata subsp. kistnae]|uniref:Peptide ABC transporter permease n=1 Tax=[Actinomadura] parvosata subsp. kistnae TaxID=1909395 RepID=A0A1V0A1Z0_9ACTN|nr:ABC transporter permease [Nonomuraea sp. ATCC 55076]AQZ64236.1 peptide ABC transporter permease [Nonomuraea sp. ATCC 55076]SPM00068.1 Dipeptide transport system permease protein DppB (TC 3.A.1.5.2) [Actinomadura parvosata subsp. kistnae]
MGARAGVRRVVRFLVSLVVLMVASFAMVHLIPGDPVRTSLGPAAPVELVAARRAALGLDRPLPEQLFTYATHVLSGNFGTSFLTGEPVGDVILTRLPNTLALALLATALALLVAVPLGMWTAVRTENGRNRGTDLAFSAATGAAVALPEFLYAIGLVAVLAIGLGWFPPAGMAGPATYVLPVVALAIGPAAMIARITRVETLRELGKDYVRLARAKRLPAGRLHLRHVLPNTLTATLTVGGLLLTSLIAGGVLVEYVFAWPGLGLKIVESITQKDYPVAQGVILVYGAIVLVVNLAVDLALGALDPTSAIKEA